MKCKYYYQASICRNVVNNTTYDMVERSFESLDDAIRWAKSHWVGEIHVKEASPDFVGEVVREWKDRSDDYKNRYDLLVIIRFRRL